MTPVTDTEKALTLIEFVRHAQLFGTECVEETARDSLLSGRWRGSVSSSTSPSVAGVARAATASASVAARPSKETQAAVVQLSVEGLIPSAIADSSAFLTVTSDALRYEKHTADGMIEVSVPVGATSAQTAAGS